MGRHHLLRSLSPLLTAMQYGLQSAFKEIERLGHEVTDAGNPIGMNLKTRYVVKLVGKEQIIDSKIQIFYDKFTGKITKVQDKWDGNLPDSTFTNVSIGQLFSPRWWVHYGESWLWWGWSFTWDTWWWQVCICLPPGYGLQVVVIECLLTYIVIGVPPA